MLGNSCHCAVKRSGAPAGCACITIVDGPHGPRFVEGEIEADGSGIAIAAAQGRADAEAKLDAEAGAPAGARQARGYRRSDGEGQSDAPFGSAVSRFPRPAFDAGAAGPPGASSTMLHRGGRKRLNDILRG